MIFPVKTAALAANIQSSIVYTGSDFQKVLGYAQPEKPISMTFSVNNQTNQVCYIAISYQTLTTTYNINDRRSIAGIPAQSTLRISSNVAAELASLGPDLVSVTLYVLSAGAGTVAVTAEGFDQTQSPGSVGGGTPIGLDQRSIQDYIQIPLFVNSTVPAASIVNSALYTVPLGKRAEILSFFATIQMTPIGSREAIITLQATTFIFAVGSEPFQAASINLSGPLANLEAGQTAIISAQNDNPGLTRHCLAIAIINEYFS